jgi:membrane fusion protein (multidrug efflux system)
VVDAGIAEAKVNMDNAERDYQRYQALLKKEAVTQQQFDNVRTIYESARARYEQASRQRTASSMVTNEQTKRVGQSSAAIKVAQAAVELARLNLGYTVIIATCDGVMGRKNIHEGQLVQPGQQLADIVDGSEVWVIANYRETQIHNISEGAEVEVTADAVPDRKFTGKVQAISDATGAAYSPVPQGNAAGNFVKVEQRVPVRIIINGKPHELRLLRAGLNVECKVKY